MSDTAVLEKMDNSASVQKYDCEVLIVGAGVAGASSLHHIMQHADSSKRVLIVDAGSQPGFGFDVNSTASSTEPSLPRYSGSAVFIENNNASILGSDQDTSAAPAEKSCNTIIKMMVQIFACSMETFINHHGIEGARTYLECTKQGLQIQKALAKQLEELLQGRPHARDLTSDSEKRNATNILIKELGSMYMALEKDAVELRSEYDRLVTLSKDSSVLDDIEWYSKEKDTNAQILSLISTCSNNQVPDIYYCDDGRSQIVTNESPFHCGIYFPNDAIIDSSLYSKLLVQFATGQIHQSVKTTESSSAVSNIDSPDRVRVLMNTMVTHIHKLQRIQSASQVVCAEGYDILTNQKIEIRCRHVVLATGGLSIPGGSCMNDLAGILQPCFSYLAHVPMSTRMIWKKLDCAQQTSPECITNLEFDDDATDCSGGSPNFFTWKFTHDWSFTDKNHIRVSGEDHFSALKESRYMERCSNLINWTYQQYNDDGCDGKIEKSKSKNGCSDCEFDENTIPQQYGVYTETPDYVPLVGFVPNDDTVCYIVGCNAWGQTILSYTASLIPAILGYRAFTPFEETAMKLLSIRRFKYFMNSGQ